MLGLWGLGTMFDAPFRVKGNNVVLLVMISSEWMLHTKTIIDEVEYVFELIVTPKVIVFLLVV